MKLKLHLALATLVIGLLGTAYSTCYLNQTVVCKNVGSFVGESWEYCSGLTYSYNVYADQAAYKLTVKTSTSGYTSQSIDGFCDSNGNPPGPDPNFGSFNVHYIDPCTGSTVPTQNGVNGPFYFKFTYNETTTTPCP